MSLAITTHQPRPYTERPYPDCTIPGAVVIPTDDHTASRVYGRPCPGGCGAWCAPYEPCGRERCRVQNQSCDHEDMYPYG
jgi:hypothetical protein